MREDLKTYYFTYGDDPEQPFCGGWTEVMAHNEEEAVRIFRAKHPDKNRDELDEGLINCSFIYHEDDFKKSAMFKYGNRGFWCHECLVYLDDPLYQKKYIIDRFAALTETFQASVILCVEAMEDFMKTLEEDGTQGGDISS